MPRRFVARSSMGAGHGGRMDAHARPVVCLLDRPKDQSHHNVCTPAQANVRELVSWRTRNIDGKMWRVEPVSNTIHDSTVSTTESHRPVENSHRTKSQRCKSTRVTGALRSVRQIADPVISDPVFFSVNDASWANRKDLGSQCGYLCVRTERALLDGLAAPCCPISWHSRRCPRVARSSGYAAKYTTIGLRISGRAQTYGNQSDVFNSQKPSCVMLTFETNIHRLGSFTQVILISVTPMLQILRIGLRKRQNGKSGVPVKHRGGWLKASLKLKEKNKTAFFSPSENWCLPASNLKPEERESVVDSGASMHMIS